MDKLPQSSLLKHLLAFLVMVLSVWVTIPDAFKGQQVMHGDAMHGFGSRRDVQAHYERTGELPNWTDRSYSGMPSTLIFPVYPNNLPSQLIVRMIKLNLGQISKLMFPMLCLYLALAIAGYSWSWSLLAALLFGLCTVNIGNIEAGHSTKVYTISTAIPLLIGLDQVMKNRLWRGFLLVAGFGAIHLAANHLQITYYTLLIGLTIFLVSLIQTIKQKESASLVKKVGILLVALVVAVLPNVSMLWSNYDYMKDSVRGNRILSSAEGQEAGLSEEYANVFSHSWLELGSTIVPRIQGGSDNEHMGTSSSVYQYVKKEKVNWKLMDKDGLVLPLFWGDKPLNGAPTYFGIAALVLLVFAMVRMGRTERLTFLSIIILTLVIALGDHTGFINQALFDRLPFFNRFRAPSMILGLTSGIVAWAIVVGFKDISSAEIHSVFGKKGFKISIGVFAAIVAYLVVLGTSVYDFSWDFGEAATGIGTDASFEQQVVQQGHTPAAAAGLMEALREDRQTAMRMDALRALVFGLLLVVFLMLYAKKNITSTVMMVGLIAFAVVDLTSVNRKYLNSQDFSRSKAFIDVFPPDPSDLVIDRMSAPYDRMFDINSSLWVDARPSYYHPSIGGNNAAKLRRYQDLIEQHLEKEIARVRSGNMKAPVPALNMLNARFIKTGPAENNYLQNITALGFAWFVDSIAWVETPEEEIAMIDSLDRAKFAIVSKEFEPNLKDLSSESSVLSLVELTSKQPGKVVYKVATDQTRLLVMSEIIYRPNEYWKSYIDGKEVGHIRANYLLRAIVVPAGSHEIRFEYEAVPFKKGEPIAAGGSLLWGIALAFGGFMTARSQRSESNSTKQ